MKIKFIKEYQAFYDFEGSFEASNIYKIGHTKNVATEAAQWLIDNGFAEEVKESGWWKPERDEHYYCVDSAGDIRHNKWWNGPWEYDRLAMGNCFKTKDTAERWRYYLKAIATVRQDEGVLTPEQIRKRVRMPAGYCYCISQSPNDASFMNIRGIRDAIASAVYFDTEEHAKASLDKHPKEWKIISNYDWSRE